MIRRPLTILCSLAASFAVLAAQGTSTSQTPPPAQTAPPPATPPQTTPKPQDPQQPTFRTRVDSVSVDVSVTDKNGKPVTDLKEGDFEIREAGKLQTIETFRLIQSDDIDDGTLGAERPTQILSMSDMQRETAKPENRLFIIYLDDYHTRAGNALHIRKQLEQFVSGLTPRDLVALLYPLTPVGAVTFSRDHDGTALGISRFTGRKYNYAATNAYEQNFAHFPAAQQEQIRADLSIRTMMSACALLATLREGRKTLVYVSEGLTGTLPDGVFTTGAPLTPGMPMPIATTQTARQQSQEFFNSVDMVGRMRDIFTICSRGNTSIWALDPKGLATSEFGAGDRVGPDQDRRMMNEAIDSLRVLADQTDGRAIIGTNDALPDLRKMVKELSAYYLLSYTSTLAPRDGKFHEIQVKVNRKDIEVRARKGYWAYSEEEIRRSNLPPKPGPPEEVAEAMDNLAKVVEPTSRRTVGVWIGAVRGETERPQVTLVWEATPEASETIAGRPEQVSLIVTAANGDVVFRGAVPRDPAAFRPTGRVTFLAPPGSLRLKVAVENARGQRLDNEDVTEIVPDFTATGASITEPQVFRARTAREVVTLRESITALPVVTRQFARSERLFMRFDAYGPVGITPQVTMRFLNRRGEPIPNAPQLAPTVKGSTFEVDFGLSFLPQGDYLIEIAAVTSIERSVKLIGIRVTG
jgi:VWFA-related protein